jgi:hypothetical protein
MSFHIVALWANKSGSFSALVQEHVKSPIALTNKKSTVKNSCIHTFTAEAVEEFLGIDPETLNGTGPKNTMNVNFDAEEVLGMKLKIQTLEAVGQEEALRLRILSRDKITGEVKGIENSHKRNGDTKMPVFSNGRPVFRKTILRGADENAEDVYVTAVEAAVPAPAPAVLPRAGEDEEGAMNIF